MILDINSVIKKMRKRESSRKSHIVGLSVSLVLIVIWAIIIVWFGLEQYYEVVGLVRRSFTSSNISIHVVYSLVRSSLQSFIHTNLVFIGGVGGLTIGTLQTEIRGLSYRRVQLELLDRIEKLESTIKDLEINNRTSSN